MIQNCFENIKPLKSELGAKEKYLKAVNKHWKTRTSWFCGCLQRRWLAKNTMHMVTRSLLTSRAESKSEVLYASEHTIMHMHITYKKLSHTCDVPSTVPTRHKLTPERTPKADPGFALSSLGVHCGSSFQKSASALGPLGVRSGSALSPLGVRYASVLGGWSGLNNSKIRNTILRDENVCVSRPGFDVYAPQCWRDAFSLIMLSYLS